MTMDSVPVLYVLCVYRYSNGLPWKDSLGQSPESARYLEIIRLRAFEQTGMNQR